VGWLGAWYVDLSLSLSLHLPRLLAFASFTFPSGVSPRRPALVHVPLVLKSFFLLGLEKKRHGIENDG
jgi:hypothetical protein